MGMHTSLYCKGCEICACAELEPIAGEGLELCRLYRTIAIVRWRDANGVHETLLRDPKRHVFVSDADAIKIAAGVAKRFVDTKLIATGSQSARCASEPEALPLNKPR